MSLEETVAKNLVELRKSKHLTQQELAEQIGYSDKSISKWELGKALPKADVLLRFAEFYGVSVDSLLHNTPIIKIEEKETPKNNVNKIILLCLAVCTIFLIAAIIYAYCYMQGINLDSVWIVFVWAIPVSFFVSSLMYWKSYGRRNVVFVILTSLFIWTLVLAFGIHFQVLLNQNIWYIMVVAVPVQAAMILISRLR